MVVRLRAVGECAIDVGPTRIGPDAELAFAVLLVLAMARGHAVARRRLTDLLWPGAPDDRARHNLRQTLYKLRQLGAPVESESLHVWLPAEAIAPSPLLDADADGDGVEPGELLRADRPFGEFLAGYVPTFSAPFAAWIEEQRSVVHARLRRAALTRLHDERRRGDWTAVDTLARKVLQLDALNEEATLALAEATVMSGSKRGAIALLDAYLRDLGPDAGDIRLPATLLRRRIAERLPPSLSPPDGDACFVGRAESMAFLHDQFRLARTAGARTVLVWGEPGIGKSRLTTEFARLAVMEGAQLARVGCQARDVERPLSMFVDIVPHLLALPGAIGCSPESMTYLRRLTALDPTVVEPAAETREAELLFAYVRRAILDLVDAVAAESSLLLVFEDVHWLDEQSWRVLRELIGWLERRRVLVLLTSRLPHATPSRPARPAAGVVEHRLGPLDRESALALFDAATPGGSAPAEYREWCVEVADGNPLFVCTCAHGAATAHPGTIGPTLKQLIGERVGSLQRPSLRVLQTTAVLGVNATDDALISVLGLTRFALLDALRDLHERRLIRSDNGRLFCRHEVISDAALALAEPCELTVLHRGAANALDRPRFDLADPRTLWDCARHWTLAGDGGRASAIVRQCAAHQISVGAVRAAHETLTRGLALTSVGADRLPLLEDLALTSSHTGNWNQCLAAIAEANELRSLMAQAEVLEILALEARWRLAEPSDRLLADTERILTDPRKPTMTRLAAGVLALIFSDHMCDATAAARIYDICTSLGRHGHADATMGTVKLIFHSSFGDLPTAVEAARVSVRIGGNDVHRIFRDRCRASIPLRRAGAHAEADELVRHAFSVAEDHQLTAPLCIAADILASSAFDQGRLADATMWWNIAHDLLAEIDSSEASASVGYLGVRIALATGEPVPTAHTIQRPLADLPRDTSVRRRIEATAAHVALAIATGDLEVVSMLTPPLLIDHLTARAFGGQDFSTATLVDALAALHRRAEAGALVAEYVGTYRREKGEWPHYLADAIRRHG